MDTINIGGISFIEFSGSRPQVLRALFRNMGLKQYNNSENGNITLHQQGNIHFISNPSDYGNVKAFRDVHKRGASAIGFKVDDADVALEHAVAHGAEQVVDTNYPIPAIRGIGTSLIYFVDPGREKKLFNQFSYTRNEYPDFSNLLLEVDHLTHNLFPGGIEKYKAFYGKLFGFISVRSFDVEGKKTGLYSEVISSKCGRVIIPLNETKDEKSQIAEYLKEYNGEGIQHIALRTNDIFQTVDTFQDNGIEFQDTPDTYYELLDKRLPDHGESMDALRAHRVLVDGGDLQGGGYLLQIFTKNSIGPIFFEYIQRKGNKGFGEGNFQALFESIELDQERRGVI